MQDLLANQHWRLNNLYKIIDKQGRIQTFKFNWAQEDLWNNFHTCNIILKARQLGISTFCCLYILDECLFTPNFTGGIIAHTREDAEYMFRRIKFAYDNLPIVETTKGYISLREAIPARNDSARELSFINNSMIRVGTSMRSSTLNILHLSEFGKICAQYPQKAEEIITGSLNTVASGQKIIIESTAEGSSGYFKEMCDKAEERAKDKTKLSPMEFRFHFFPWWKHTEYQLKDAFWHQPQLLQYYEQLKGKGIKLSEYQKNWYSQKYNVQKDGMLREYPSTPQEAFQASTESQYYARYINQARDEKRITVVNYDPALPVHTAWDLGYFDAMSVWYFQVMLSGDIRIIDFHETTGQSLKENIQIIKSKPYIYGDHYVPHDAKSHELSTGLTRLEIAYDLGVNMTVVPRLGVQDGIDLVKSTLPRCWIDENRCKLGIEHLANYAKEWNAALGRPEERPKHDEHSHASDSARYMCVAIHTYFRQDKTEILPEKRLPAFFDTERLPNSYFQT